MPSPRRPLALGLGAAVLVGAVLGQTAGAAHAPTPGDDAAPRLVLSATRHGSDHRAADHPPTPSRSAARTQPARTQPARPDPARRAWQRMSLPQRVGQLFMVGTPAARVDPAARAQIHRLHVGNVMLTGRSHGGVRPAARVSRELQRQVGARSTAGVPLFVGTDQEGGLVQVLQGGGFSDLPSGLQQGHWSPGHLHRAAARWARQLRQAGVNVNLAPVLDTVPGPRAARHNPPVGHYGRELGYTPAAVRRQGLAVARGMSRAGVVPAAKHFPGLGRVHANTDTSAHVTDRVTTRHDAYLRPFRAAIRAGVPMVMMSTAYYQRLDPHRPAAFSRFVITTMLRGDLGFDGVVISDDLARAREVARFSPGARAVRFLAAGGDLVLSVDPDPVPEMYDAVLDRARRHDRFRDRVGAAALRVLEAKRDRGLL